MATDRVILGQRNGAYGLWVSKPGIDVDTALPGQFLIDSNSTIYQVLASGNTTIVTNPSGGTYQVSVPLPAELAGISRLWMMGAPWARDSYRWISLDVSVYLYRYWFRVSSGNAILGMSGFSAGGAYNTAYFGISWIVFREAY